MRTEDFDAKSRSMRTTLKLSQDQAAAVTTAFTALGGAFTQAGTQAGASASGIDRAATSLKNVKKASDDVAGGLGGVSSGIKSLSTSLGGLAIAAVSFQAIKSGVEGLLASATASQSLTAAFTAIAGSAQEGQKQLDFVRATADKLGFSFTTLAGSYKGLSAASRGTILEGQATRDIFTAVATASRVLQLSTQDTGGVLLAVQQIISKGTVQSEELRGQIGERLPGAFGIAARAMGVTEKELSKLLETGQVASTVFIPKFAAQLQREFAGGAEAASKTFAAASERLGNSFARIGEAVAQSGLLDHLGKMLDKLTGIIAAGPNAADALRGVVTAQTQKDLNLSTPGFTASTQGQALIQHFNELLVAKQAEIDAVRKTPPLAFGAGGLEDVSATVLNRLEKELRDIQKAKSELLVAVGRAAQGAVAQVDGLTDRSGISNRRARSQDLAKVLQAQADELTKALAPLDVKAALAPGSAVEIVEEKVKLLDKAIKALQDTLATNKDLLPLLQGKGTPGALRGANAAGMATALPLIQAQASSYGLDPSLVAALVYEESRFNQRAVSPKGARGMGQLMPGTAAGLGVSDSFDIQQNLMGTMKYLQQLSVLFKGNAELMLAAYNAGPGRVTRAGGIPNIPETQDYVRNVLARQRAIQGSGLPGSEVGGPQQLTDLMQQRERLQAELKATQSFDKEIMAQRQERWKDLDIFGLTLAPEQEAALKEAAKAQHERIKAFAEELDIFGLELSPEQERQIKLIQKSTDALRAYQEQLELSGGALDAFGRATKVTAEARAVTQAEGRLRNLPPELQVEGAQVVDRLRRAAQEATPLFQGLKNASDEFASSFLSAIESASQGGITSFKSFADSVIRDLLRIAAQQYLQPALSQLLNAGLKLGLTALGALGSTDGGGLDVGGSTGPSADFAAAGGGGGSASTLFDTGGAFRAEGGPVMPGGFYRVGERGPETLLAMGRGYVLPNDAKRASGSDRPIIININGVSDFPSFQRSSGQVRRAIRQGVDDATREL